MCWLVFCFLFFFFGKSLNSTNLESKMENAGKTANLNNVKERRPTLVHDFDIAIYQHHVRCSALVTNLNASR